MQKPVLIVNGHHKHEDIVKSYSSIQDILGDMFMLVTNLSEWIKDPMHDVNTHAVIVIDDYSNPSHRRWIPIINKLTSGLDKADLNCNIIIYTKDNDRQLSRCERCRVTDQLPK